MGSQSEEKGGSTYPADALDANYEIHSNQTEAQGTTIDIDAEYGHVTRRLKSRHVQFIALGGTIGIGLFLNIGTAFTRAGPLSVLLGYSITGIAVYAMMQCLGEMATWLPLPGAVPQFCSRYVDDALGFAVGWNNWYYCAVAICVEIAAAGVVIGFWNTTISVAVWITVLIIVIVSLNIFAVSIYGEAEFIFASIKIFTIIGLIILAVILDLGGGPNHDRLGFRYWKHPGAMKEYRSTGNLGRFLGLFSVLVNAAFSYAAVEFVAVAAGETENPRKNIPKAVRRIFWRILFFYVIGTLAIGVLVPSNDTRLLSAQAAGVANGAASPWVIAITRAGIPVLPSLINAVIVTSATSSANAMLYTGSRYLYAMAEQRQAPRVFLKCTKSGVPIYAVAFTSSFSLLTYLSVSSGSDQVLQWFSNLTTVATLMTWISICIAYIGFYHALKAQGIDRSTLVFRSRFQPYTAWFALVFFVIVLIFNGWAVFVHGFWNVSDFIAAYIGIPLYIILFVVWKVVKRSKWRSATEVDLMSGKAEIDAQEVLWADTKPRNWVERVWFWIA